MKIRKYRELQDIFRSNLSMAGFDSGRNFLVVGYSGGMDSGLLLKLAVDTCQDRTSAIHVNHAVDGNADSWEQFCRSLCEQLQIELVAEKLVPDAGMANQRPSDGAPLTSENDLREARYRIFEKYVKKDDWLLLAHHADDQAETVMLRLLRGTGLEGLAGIPSKRKLGKGTLFRPLLQQTRADLRRVADSVDLQWIDDPGNELSEFDRNYLRHEIFPLLNRRWPHATGSFGALATRAGEYAEDQQRELPKFARQIDLRPEAVGSSVSADRLMSLSPFRRKSVLRYLSDLILNLNLERHYYDLIENELCLADPQSNPVLKLGTVQFRRAQGRMFFLPLLPDMSHRSLDWDMTEPLEVAGLCTLQTAEPAQARQLKIQFRRGGERCKPVDRAHSQSLKKVLQERAVLPWMRDITPMLFEGEQMLAFGDSIICDSTLPQLQLDWHIQ